MENKRYLELDFYRTSYKSVKAHQYDKNTRFIEVTCINDASVYSLNPKTMTSNLKLTTPDGRHMWKSTVIQSDGTVLIELEESMLLAAGICKAELNIYDLDSEKLLSTMPFDLIVIGSVYDNSVIESTNEFNVLNDLLFKAHGLFETLKEHMRNFMNPHKVNKDQVGLGNCDNTADIDKNVNSAKKLTTSRNINGTAFDGTVDIITDKWGKSRTVKLSGDVSASKVIDGSSDVDISVEVKDNSHNHTVSNISDLTATASELNVLDGITASTAELNYTDGVTSNIQTQLDSKAPIASPTLTGTPKAPTATAGTNTTQIATTAFAQTSVSNHNTSSTAHNDIRNLITELTTRLNALADSDDTTLDQLSEIVAYIKNNRSLIDSITTSKVNVSDIVDNLTSTATNKPLSAKQGKVLKDLINALTSVVGDKVDKVTGKGLSTNDYTTSEKNKLSGIAAGAEVNVQADWNITDTNSDAYIKNKPTSMPASNTTSDYSPTGTDPVNGIAVNKALQNISDSGGSVTGVKGNAETSYRKGNVNITPANIGLGNVPNVTTNDQTPTFTQAETRTNIVSGEKLSVILGKIKKFFSDLKTVAFSGNYNDLTNKPTSMKNPNALNIQLNWVPQVTYDGSSAKTVNITPTGIGALPTVGGTITGNLRLQGPDEENYGRKLNFGDSDYVYLHEYEDDKLKIVANKIVLSAEDGVSVEGSTIEGNISGTAASAAKWTTARMIGITGDMVGGESVDGSANAFVKVIRRGCVVGQSGSTATKPFYNFASVRISDYYTDRSITFHVTQSYSDHSSEVGILTAHVRTDGTRKLESGELVWEYAASGVDVSKYRFTCDEETTGVVFKLWVKIDIPYKHIHFDVISESDRVIRTPYLWSLRDKSSVGGDCETLPGSEASTLAVLSNPTRPITQLGNGTDGFFVNVFKQVVTSEKQMVINVPTSGKTFVALQFMFGNIVLPNESIEAIQWESNGKVWLTKKVASDYTSWEFYIFYLLI